jgi:hypothetical protein
MSNNIITLTLFQILVICLKNIIGRLKMAKGIKLTTAKVTVAKTKVVKKTKSAEDKLNTKLAKLESVPDFFKVATPDFLDLLAANIERGDGMNFHSAEHGVFTVKPKSPKELANTVKYLRRLATK